jgi:hypothetical protein
MTNKIKIEIESDEETIKQIKSLATLQNIEFNELINILLKDYTKYIIENMKSLNLFI